MEIMQKAVNKLMPIKPTTDDKQWNIDHSDCQRGLIERGD